MLWTYEFAAAHTVCTCVCFGAFSQHMFVSLLFRLWLALILEECRPANTCPPHNLQWHINTHTHTHRARRKYEDRKRERIITVAQGTTWWKIPWSSATSALVAASAGPVWLSDAAGEENRFLDIWLTQKRRYGVNGEMPLMENTWLSLCGFI